MARVLHLLPHADTGLAAEVIRRDVDAGDDVAVALLAGGGRPSLPGGVSAHRVPDDWSYDELLARIFDADRVITW